MINVWFVNIAIASTALWDIIEWDIGKDTATAKDVLIIVKVVKIIGVVINVNRDTNCNKATLHASKPSLIDNNPQ